MPKKVSNIPCYQSWRKMVLKRDNYICQDCGKPAKCVHHIKSYINNPKSRLKVNNGKALCEECHKKYPKERLCHEKE